jgi:hypothetical protein
MFFNLAIAIYNGIYLVCKKVIKKQIKKYKINKQKDHLRKKLKELEKLKRLKAENDARIQKSIQQIK